MNTLVEHILAAMISIISPGMSNYSQVPMVRCAAECQATPRCENKHDFRCRPPQLSMSLYRQRQRELVAQGVSPEDAIMDALELSYARPETYEEGLARYYVLVTNLVAVARRNSYSACLSDNVCNSKSGVEGEDSLSACYLQCRRTAKWTRPYDQLAWAMFTTSSLESGWRSDVQAGTGMRGRGDCEWEKDGKRVKAWTDGAQPIISTCNSFGLNQAWFGNPPIEKHHYFGKVTYLDVMGLDSPSTRNSFNLAARHLISAYLICKGVEHDWAWSMFSMYGSGHSCKADRSKSRAGRYHKYSYGPNRRALAAKHHTVLATPEAQALITYLGSSTKLLWMPAETYVPKPKVVDLQPMEIAAK